MKTDLATVLETARAEALVIRRAGHDAQATMIEDLCASVEAAAHPWVNWLSESNALLRSGWKLSRLRGKYADLEREGHAKRRGKERWYRECMIPMRDDANDARAAGVAAGQRMRRAS